MVEQETVDIATGEVRSARWYLLTSLSSRQCGPQELLRLFRNHWSIENRQHHVKDRSWDADVHTLRRPGLGKEVFATLVNTGLNALRLEGWFPPRMSMPLDVDALGCRCPCEPKLAPSAQRRPSTASTVEPPDFAIVLRPTSEEWIEALEEIPAEVRRPTMLPRSLPTLRPAPSPRERRQPPRRAPALERSCPKCKSRNARLRRDWHRRYNALRCGSCNEVFGRTLIKRCPNCGSQEARLRRDWHSRGRPFRCLKCNTVFGGTDQMLPAEPAVGRTPNLARYLVEATATEPEAGRIVDRARGVMLGVVVGNLLGLPIEGRSRQWIEKQYPHGVTEIRPAEMAKPMDDDPAQSVELAEALLEGGDPVERFAARLVAWSLLNGRGMGRTTRQSINQLKDKVPPPVAAYAVYRAKGENASNGGIMRCAPVAIARRRQPELLVQDTADTCAVSHYAPASRWSCVIVNAAIAVLLSGGTPDLKQLLGAAKADGCLDLAAVAREAGVPTGFLEDAVRGRSTPGDTEWMRGNRGPNGHTILTMQAGFWASTTPLNFEEALVALVNAGGDTDTNGALAGAVLGARYGASAIPLRWTSHVAQRERLTDLADRLVRL